LRGQLVDPLVYRRIVHQPSESSVAALDLLHEQVDAVADLCELPVQFVIRHQPAHGAGAGTRVAHEGIEFLSCRVGVVVDSGIGEKLAKCPLTTIDPVSNLLEVFTEYLEVGNNVICSLNDSTNVTFFSTLECSAVLNDCSRFGSASDVYFAVAEQSDC